MAPMALAPASTVTAPIYKLAHVLPCQEAAISSLKFSPNGQFLVNSSADGLINLWDGLDGKHVKSFEGHKMGVTDIGWSHDSSCVVSASDDKTLKIWDVGRGQCVRTLEGHTHFVFSCTFNHASYIIASGGFDGTVKTWDVRSRDCLITCKVPKDGPVSSVDFSKDDSEILSSTYAGICIVWDSTSGRCVSRYKDEESMFVTFAKFTTEDYLLLGTMKNSIKLWTRSGACETVYEGYKNENYCIPANVSYSPTRDPRLISGSEDDLVYVWDLKSGEIIQKLHGHADVVMCTDSHPTEDIIASGALDKDRRIMFWKNTP